MINSMTGYGCAEGRLGGVTYAVEIKTVNTRYFRARIKLPDSVAFLEGDIEKLLEGNVSRGAISYTLGLKDVPANVLVDIDETALKAYLERLNGVASSARLECRVDICSLLSLPGILVPVSPAKEQVGQIRSKVLSITQEAIEHLKEMRAVEGAALGLDLEKHCEAISKDLEQIRLRSSTVLAEYRKKLKKKIEVLLMDGRLELDEAVLAREVAVFAERSDISEEIARLDSHLQQFAKSCREDGQAGRKLDFISQEMLREANTIASKAADTEIAKYVVDMKCHIDRIKEQVQNVE